MKWYVLPVALVLMVGTVVLWLLLKQESGTDTDHQNSHSEKSVEQHRVAGTDSSEAGQAVAAEIPADAVSKVFGQGEPEIFTAVDESELDSGVLAEYVKDRPVYRYRIVKVDTDSLRAQIRDEFDSEITLNFFDDFRVTAIAQRKRERTTGSAAGVASWGGIVKGYEEYSSVTLTIGQDDVLSGSIRGPFGVYYIGQVGQPSYQIVWQRDPSVPVVTD